MSFDRSRVWRLQRRQDRLRVLQRHGHTYTGKKKKKKKFAKIEQVSRNPVKCKLGKDSEMLKLG
jgi:hypothetical protein